MRRLKRAKDSERKLTDCNEVAYACAMPLLTWFEMKVLSLILVLLGSCTLAQERLPELGGSWTASLASGQIFRGTWSGQTSRQNPNAARGSWTLLNEAGEIILEGTWSSQKMRQSWQGTWTSRAHRGAALSGTWNADLASFSGKTMQAMLERTAEREVAGSWRTRGYQGNWWLKGSHSNKLQRKNRLCDPSVPIETTAFNKTIRNRTFQF